MKNKIINILLIAVVLGFVGKYIYQLPKYSDGEKAPEIEATLMNGEEFKLSDLQGQYVLLDFWGSWCGPCRKENPKLVKLWNAFQNKNFQIVSVSVESSESQWKNAIQKDGLLWKYHIGQFKRFKSPIVKAYGVKVIPTKYLINPKGEIIEVNPSMDEISNILSNQ